MKYHERMVQTVSETFANHQITKRSEGRWLIQRPHKDQWDDPERRWDWTMAAEIICLRTNALYVGGDIFPVLFGYGPQDHMARIRWMGRCDDITYYVQQKVSIGMHGLLDHHFDTEEAESDLRDLIQQRIEQITETDWKAEWDDELYTFFDNDVTCYDWPMSEDERDIDDEVEGPYHLREFIADHMKGDYGLDDMTAWDALKRFLAEHDGLDDMELIEKTKPWLAERQQVHRESKTKDDRIVEAIEETIREIPDSDSRSLYISLRDNIHAAAKDRDDHYFGEESYNLGNVVAPRVYYAHAALRKLCELLDAEEEKEKRHEP